MAKEPQESPADKLKKELSAKAAEEAERIANMTEEDVGKENGDATKEPTEDEPKMAEEAPVADFEEPAEPIENVKARQKERAAAARDKLLQIAQSYPVTTPNEHTIFGFGGVRYHLGDLRDLFGLNTRP